MNALSRSLIIAVIVGAFVPSIAAQTRRTVILSGASKSVSGTNWKFVEPRRPVINSEGQIAFSAQVERGTNTTDLGSIWWENGSGSFKLIAADDNAAPGLTGVVYAHMIDSLASLNAVGQIAYRTSLAGGSTSTLNDSGLWITTNSQASPTIVIREGDAADDTTGVFDEQSYDTLPPTTPIPVPAYPIPITSFNADGNVTAHTHIRNGSNITVQNDNGIWFDGRSTTQLLVVRESDPARSIANRFYSEFPVSPRLNDDNEVAYRAPIRDTALGTDTGEGIWVGNSVGPTKRADTIGLAPGVTSAHFDSFKEPVLNNNGSSPGEFAFAANLQIAGAVNINNDEGIWSQRRSESGSLIALNLIIREGQHAPGTPSTVGFSTFDGVNINKEAQLAFRATLANIAGGGTVNPQNDSGLWIRNFGTISDVETTTPLVAREGDTAPGTTGGAVFGTLAGVTDPAFSEPTINSLGQVAWMAHLSGGTVTTANDTGIWFKNGPGPTILIAREGFPFDVNDGAGVDNRTVQSLFMWTNAGGEDGRRSGLNSPATGLVSQLVFGATFTDNSSGVFAVTLPALPPPPVLGDYNGNGIVDAADYTIWRDTLGQTGTGLAADGDGNGTVNNADYTFWKSRFGNTSGSGSASANAAVPEPTCLFPLVAVIGGLLIAKRR